MLPFIIITVVVIALLLLVWIVSSLIMSKLRENEGLKYEFITIVTHKFRTPLTQIKWTTENLISQEQDSYKKQSLSEIAKSNESLIKLTNTLVGLTDATRISRSTYNLQSLDMCALAKAAIESAKNSFHEKNLFISFSSTEPELFVNGEKSRMEYVIGTLLENACIYTPTGRNVSITATANRRKVAISVKDDGIGIAPGDIPHITTKFFRTKQAQSMDTEGFGVGLYLANSIIKRHKGKLVISSPGLNQGSTFSVILPRARHPGRK